MYKQVSQSSRRKWISLNFFSLALILFFFYLGRSLDSAILFFAGGSLSVLAAIITFLKAFIYTGLWKMVHSHTSLDERQTQVLLNALKNSYSIFTISVLVLVYGFAFVDKRPIDVLLAACLLYVAHILPAAIIGWKEKAV